MIIRIHIKVYFEENFSKWLGSKYGTGVGNGTDAIKLALLALEIGKDDEVITVSNTAVPTISGRVVSNQFAKNVLSEIISDEDKKKPYSDSRLSELLKERDILISRRTVAKYRDQLNILSSSLRRKI